MTNSNEAIVPDIAETSFRKARSQPDDSGGFLSAYEACVKERQRAPTNRLFLAYQDLLMKEGGFDGPESAAIRATADIERLRNALLAAMMAIAKEADFEKK